MTARDYDYHGTRTPNDQGNTIDCLRLITFLAFLALAGCTSVQLVSNYDEVMDRETAALHRKLESYFVSLPAFSAEERKYKNQQKFYQQMLVDLAALKLRASAIYKNDLTLDQLDLVEENMAYLILLHKNCITTALTQEQKNKVKENGIDVSMDCKREHGASSDSSNRGDETINPFVISPIRAMFAQQFTAIMALELAKKRGEN